MAIQDRTSLRNGKMDAITTDIGTSGKLKIYTSAYGTLLGTWVWTGTNMFGASSGGVITMEAPASASITAAATGTAAIGKITTSADVDVRTGLTVGTSGTHIIVDSTTITSGDPIVLNYAASTITAPYA